MTANAVFIVVVEFFGYIIVGNTFHPPNRRSPGFLKHVKSDFKTKFAMTIEIC